MTDAFRKTPLPVVLAILSFIAPTEISLVVGDLRLSPHRLVFLLFLPFALYRLAMRADCRLHLYDLPFFGLACWQTFVFTYHAGNAGFAFGGSLALESFGAYAIARAYIRDLETLRATLRIVLYSVVLAGAIAVLDTLSGSQFVHAVLRSVLGGEPLPPIEYRMGLVRAYSTFDHPIHYGTYCATMFALLWMSEPRRLWRIVHAAGVAVAAGLALSSAPILSLALQGGMMGWNTVTRSIPYRAQLSLAILVGLYIGAELVASRSLLQIIISIATFDPWTGYYRMLIWEYGLENLWTSPWLGIGMEDWERPRWMVAATIDSYWLVLTLRSGLPAFLLVATGVVLVGRGVVKRGRTARDPLRRNMAAGWMISLVAISFLGATVHFWNVPHALFYFFLGLGSALADPRPVRSAASALVRPIRRRHPSFIPAAPRPALPPGAALPA